MRLCGKIDGVDGGKVFKGPFQCDYHGTFDHMDGACQPYLASLGSWNLQIRKELNVNRPTRVRALLLCDDNQSWLRYNPGKGFEDPESIRLGKYIKSKIAADATYDPLDSGWIIGTMMDMWPRQATDLLKASALVKVNVTRSLEALIFEYMAAKNVDSMAFSSTGEILRCLEHTVPLTADDLNSRIFNFLQKIGEGNDKKGWPKRAFTAMYDVKEARDLIFQPVAFYWDQAQ